MSKLIRQISGCRLELITRLKALCRQIFNWSPMMRCAATMFVDSSMELTFLLWKVLLVTPTMGHALNHTVLAAHYPVALMMIVTSLLISVTCFMYRQSQRLKLVMPMFCAFYIGLTLCYHSYLVGTLAPITGVLLVGAGVIGLLLFGRRVIYPVLLLAVVILSSLTYAAMIGKIPYAPLFYYAHLPFPQESIWWLINTTALYSVVLISVVSLFDLIITAWWRQSQEILHLSQTDSLTRLYNRRSLTTYLQSLAQQTQPTCLILMDLDHFKSINDTYGHLVGDQVLQDTAKQLAQTVRQGDWVGRYGGEEFIVVLPHTELEQAVEVAERCRIAISQVQIGIANPARTISGSFGVLHLAGTFDMSHALSQVDALLYQAKHQGRNCVVAQSLHLAKSPAQPQ